MVGSTIYSTTYPCHNCAKHIVDAGITRVVYLEPYEKSLARTLHADTINDPLQERSEWKVSFDNFGGVAPKRFGDFFKPQEDRKKDGVFADSDRKRAVLFPAHQEEISTLRERLRSLESWFDAQPSSEEGGEEADQPENGGEGGGPGGSWGPGKTVGAVVGDGVPGQTETIPEKAEDGPKGDDSAVE